MALDSKNAGKLPPLPSWEEAQKRAREQMEETGPARPAWFDKFEEANRERMPWLRREDDEDIDDGPHGFDPA